MGSTHPQRNHWCGLMVGAILCVGSSARGQSNDDVAQLFARACLGCHSADGASGLDLTRPGTLARRALTAAQLVRTGVMPPWLPSGKGPPLRASRALSAHERAALANWLEAGSHIADKHAAPVVNGAPGSPSLPLATNTSDPVVSLRIGDGWMLTADPGLSVRSFAVTPSIESPLRVGGFELVADNPGVVHQVSFLSDARGYGLRLDASDPAPGYDAVGDIGLIASGSGGTLSRLAPRIRLPDEFSIEVPAHAALVVEAHASARGRVESPAAAIRFFSATPGATLLTPYSFSASREVTLGRAARAVSISIRAGSRVESVAVVAINRTGEAMTLLDIPAWNERFSEPWFFDPPVRLGEGTRLEVRSTTATAAQRVPLDAHAAAMNDPTVVLLVSDDE